MTDIDTTLNEDASSTSYDEGAAEGVVTPPAGDDTATQSGSAEASPDVPFHEHPRWKEVLAERDRYRQESENYSAFADHIKTLRDNGLNSAADVQAFLQRQQDEQARLQQKAAFDYSEPDPETAALKYTAWEAKQEAQRAAAEAENARREAANFRLEQDLTAVQGRFPYMDPATVRERFIANQGRIPLAQLAQADHDRVAAAEQRAIAKYNADKTRQRAAPTPEGSGGTAPPRPGIPSADDPKAFMKWFDAQANATERARS